MVQAQLSKAWSTACMQDVRGAGLQNDTYVANDQQNQHASLKCKAKPRRRSCSSVLGRVSFAQNLTQSSTGSYMSSDQWQPTVVDNSTVADTGGYCVCRVAGNPITSKAPSEAQHAWISSHTQTAQYVLGEQLLQSTAARGVLPRSECSPSVSYSSKGASRSLDAGLRKHRNSNASTASYASDEGSCGSGAAGDRRLLEMLQLDCRWQAQQLKIKEQQFNDLMLRHEMLLREYLEVKAANQALQLEQQEQHKVRCVVDAHHHLPLQQGMLPYHMCSLPSGRPSLDQLQLIQPDEALMQGPASQQSPSGTAIMQWQVYPTPPLAGTRACRPPPRRNLSWSSAEQLTLAAGAAIVDAEASDDVEVQCPATISRANVTPASRTSSANAGQGSKVVSPPAAYAADVQVQGSSEGAETVSANTSVSPEQRRTSAQRCSAMQHMPAARSTCPNDTSLDVAHAAQQHTGTPQQTSSGSKFAPTPPPHSPSVEGGRARRLRDIAKRTSIRESGPAVVVPGQDLTTESETAVSDRQHSAPSCRPWSLDGGLSSIRKSLDCSAMGGAAAFAADLEKYRGLLQLQQ